MKRKSTNVLLLVILMLWLIPSFAYAETCLGAPLPSGSTKVGENRYLLDKNWEQALKYYRRAFQSTRNVSYFKALSLPGVSAEHYENTGKGPWKGANLSRIRGKVYFFCYADSELPKQKKP